MLASIRGRLMLLVFTSIALVWGVALVASYRQATHEVEVWENARLAELAKMLARVSVAVASPSRSCSRLQPQRSPNRADRPRSVDRM
ncbi:hypothetical protein P3T23_006314 [Paraburkholderia sp. GAS448]|uniref:hypothetical protein n=1 Tax=Paraburkholderia sp. GAS448 TaxID=3035136 RepID=UPI003D1B4F12